MTVVFVISIIWLTIWGLNKVISDDTTQCVDTKMKNNKLGSELKLAILRLVENNMKQQKIIQKRYDDTLQSEKRCHMMNWNQNDGVYALTKLNLPMYFYNMVPYVVVLVVLAFSAGKSRAPKAEGIPYDKGQR